MKIVVSTSEKNENKETRKKNENITTSNNSRQYAYVLDYMCVDVYPEHLSN